MSSAPRRKSRKTRESKGMSLKKSKSKGGWFGGLFSSKKKSSSRNEIVSDSADFNLYRSSSAVSNYTAIESCAAPRMMSMSNSLCTDSAMASDSFRDDFLMSHLDDCEEEEILCDSAVMQPNFKASKKSKAVKLEFNWLLNQQKASGMFNFAPTDPRFIEYSKKSIDSQVRDKLKDKSMLNSVLATLFALAALESQFATRRTEWQFMFAKGKSFITKQLNDKSEFDGLLSLLQSDWDELNALLS